MSYIEQAYKGKNEWWRYLLSILFMLFGWQFVGIIPLVLLALNKTTSLAELGSSSENAFADLGIDKNIYLLAMLLMFAIGLVFLLISVKRVHKRSIRSLVTSRSKVDWQRVIYGFGFWFAVSFGFLVLDYFVSPDHYEFNFKPLPFLILFIISFIFIPLQTSFEELLFRGYFIQGLGVWFKNAAVPLIVTSVTFGLLHGFNPEVEKLGRMIMIYYIGTGLFFGIITLMDDGVELALGMHAANNIVAALFVTANWAALQTDALFKDVSEPSLSMEMLLPVFVVYPVIIVVFSKKYGWKNWKQKLFGNIKVPVNSNE